MLVEFFVKRSDMCELTTVLFLIFSLPLAFLPLPFHTSRVFVTHGMDTTDTTMRDTVKTIIKQGSLSKRWVGMREIEEGDVESEVKRI